MLDIVTSYHFMHFNENVWSKLKEIAKNLILGQIQAHWTQIRAANFFFKNLGFSVTRYHDQLSSCKISGKTDDPILRKFSDGRTDKSDFIGRSPTEVVRPKITL